MTRGAWMGLVLAFGAPAGGVADARPEASRSLRVVAGDVRRAPVEVEIVGPWQAGAWLVVATDDDERRLVASGLPTRPPARSERVGDGLEARLARSPAPDTRVIVQLLPARSCAALVSDAAKWAGVTVVSAWDSALAPEVRLDVAGSTLAAVTAQLVARQDVLRFDADDPLHAMSDDAGWWLQTADHVAGGARQDEATALFAHGLTGRGLLLAQCDDGLENDHCPFVYATGDRDEIGWPLGPAAGAADPVPAEQAFRGNGHPAPIRTRERKVVAYLLQDGAAAYSSPNQHGTTVAAVACGDDPLVLAARPLIRDLGEEQDVWPWRPGGSWTEGEEIRPDLLPRVDDPSVDEPGFTGEPGQRVEHHQHADGIAPGAQLVFQDIGNAQGTIDVRPSVEAMLVQASRLGATTWIGPWGGSPCRDCYDALSRGVDAACFARRDLVVVVPVGNWGSGTDRWIGRGTAHSKDAITAGWAAHPTAPSCDPCSAPAAPVGEAMSCNSSTGPASGGRLAPLLASVGTVAAKTAIGFPPPRPEDGTGSGDGSCASARELSGGTSFAAATLAGASLLVQQYFQDGYYPRGAPATRLAMRPTNALVKAVLVNCARPLRGDFTAAPDGSGSPVRPNHRQGWGAPVLDDTLAFSGDPAPHPQRTTVERSRLLVLNDVPNGVDGAWPLAPEAGGWTRERIVADFRPALSAGEVHEFLVDVVAPPAGEDLRFTLAWSDWPSLTADAPLVNDLDLEVVSPGPDGILDTAGATAGGDDVVYRTDPETCWRDGASVSVGARTLLVPGAPGAGRDGIDVVENVFVRPSEVREGRWLVRVVAWSIQGTGVVTGTPNFVLLDMPPTRDGHGRLVPDEDEADVVSAGRQGYALIVSGPVRVPDVRLPPFDPPRLPRGGTPRRQ